MRPRSGRIASAALRALGLILGAAVAAAVFSIVAVTVWGFESATLLNDRNLTAGLAVAGAVAGAAGGSLAAGAAMLALRQWPSGRRRCAAAVALVWTIAGGFIVAATPGSWAVSGLCLATATCVVIFAILLVRARMLLDG